MLRYGEVDTLVVANDYRPDPGWRCDHGQAKGTERILSAISGVREIFTGDAVQGEAKYRYIGLFRFCHPAVIDSYREHPVRVDFADRLFRPVAGERINIDYQALTATQNRAKQPQNTRLTQ